MSEAPQTQAGVIPWRRISGGRIEILLIASRGVDAWRIPHGLVQPGADETASAASAASEEAGVRGRMESTPLGSYVCRLETGHARVRVFPLEVSDIAETWPSSSRIERRWFRRDEAIGEIALSGLREVVRRFLDQAG